MLFNDDHNRELAGCEVPRGAVRGVRVRGVASGGRQPHVDSVRGGPGTFPAEECSRYRFAATATGQSVQILSQMRSEVFAHKGVDDGVDSTADEHESPADQGQVQLSRRLCASHHVHSEKHGP